MEEPPEFAGAVKLTETEPPVPPEAEPIVGAPGTVVATTADDAEDDGEVAVVLVAVTV